MRTIPFLSSLLLTASIPTLALASGGLVPLSDYHVAPITAKSADTPSYCAIATHYSSDTPIVTITRNTHKKSSFAFDFQNAAFEKGAQYGLTLKVGLYKKTFAARAISTTQLVLQSGEDDAIYRQWRNGHNMMISLDGTQGVYHVGNNPKAGQAFEDCLAQLSDPIGSAPVYAEALPTRKMDEPPSLNMAANKTPSPKAEPLAIVQAQPVQPQPAKPRATTIQPIEAAVAQAPAREIETPVSTPIETVETISIINPPPTYTPNEPLPLINNEALFGNIQRQEAAIENHTARDALKSSLAAARQQASEQETRIRNDIESAVTQEPLVEAMPIMPMAPLPVIEPVQYTETSTDDVSPVQQVAIESDIQEILFDTNVPAAPYTGIAAQETVQETTQETAQEVTHEYESIPVINVPDRAVRKAPPVQPDIIWQSAEDNTPIAPQVIPAAPVAPAVTPPAPTFDNTPSMTQPPAQVTPRTPVHETITPSMPEYMPPRMPVPKSVLSVSAEPPATHTIKPYVKPSATPFVTEPLKPSAQAPVATMAAETGSHYLNTVTPSVGQNVSQASATMRTARSEPFSPPPASPINRWTVRTLQSPDKKDDFCLIENNFDNNLMLMVGQRTDGYSTIGINYGVGMLSPNRTYAVNVRVDNSFDEDFSGYAETPNMLVVQMGKKQSLFQALQQAQAMRVAMPGVASSFVMDDLSRALDQLSDCLVSIGGDGLTAPTYAAPVPSAPVVPVPYVETVSLDNDPMSAWTRQTEKALKTAGFQIHNTSNNGQNIQAQNQGLTAKASRINHGDVMETAIATIDGAENACSGAFSTEIGVPEQRGNITMQQMESRCQTAQGTEVSTWLVENQSDNVSTVWNITGFQENNREVFDVRYKIVKAIENESSRS